MIETFNLFRPLGNEIVEMFTMKVRNKQSKHKFIVTKVFLQFRCETVEGKAIIKS